MKIDENTKIIARFCADFSPRTLNIYNPFFQDNNINALYVLFYDQDPAKLISSMRSLRFAGATLAGFKTGSVPPLLDGLDAISQYINKVGCIKNVDGRLIGSTQGGEGLYRTINAAGSIENKELVIVGSGNMTKAFLYFLKSQKSKPKKITLVNRTVEKATVLANEYEIVTEVKSLDELGSTRGDILVNSSHIGGSVEDAVYNKEIVANFKTLVDVTFEKEDTKLITLGKNMGKTVATGWDMFTAQGQISLENILDIKIDFTQLKKYVVKGLTETVK